MHEQDRHERIPRGVGVGSRRHGARLDLEEWCAEEFAGSATEWRGQSVHLRRPMPPVFLANEPTRSPVDGRRRRGEGLAGSASWPLRYAVPSSVDGFAEIATRRIGTE